jgi:hypothetical protein
MAASSASSAATRFQLTASGRACRHQPRRVQRIDVDFQEGTAIIRWTFTDSTAKINLARGKARSRERIRASHKDSIDALVEAQCGHVVDPGDSSWNLPLAELSRLSKILEQSTNDRDHESSSTAAPELRER